MPNQRGPQLKSVVGNGIVGQLDQASMNRSKSSPHGPTTTLRYLAATRRLLSRPTQISRVSFHERSLALFRPEISRHLVKRKLEDSFS